MTDKKEALVKKLKELNIEVQQTIDELVNYNVEVIVSEGYLPLTRIDSCVDIRTIKFIAKEIL